jgi:hypothetical protein
VKSEKGKGQPQNLHLQLPLTIFFAKIREFDKINIQRKKQQILCQKTHVH